MRQGYVDDCSAGNSHGIDGVQHGLFDFRLELRDVEEVFESNADTHSLERPVQWADHVRDRDVH